jgi:Flp pilus assembly pilin Flp
MNELVTATIEEPRGEEGQALAEYGLILAFIFAVCVIAVTALGLAISGGFGGVIGAF